MEIRSYRDLRVWHAAVDMVVDVYRLTETFPRHEVYGLGASLAELDTQLEIASRLQYAPPEGIGQIQQGVGSVGRQLYALRNTLPRPLG